MEKIHEVPVLVLGDKAIGTIERAGRELDQATLKRFEKDVAGDRFDVRLDAHNFFVASCIDGRTTATPEEVVFTPNGAGGSLTPFVGELLTDSIVFSDKDKTDSVTAFNSFATYLKTLGYSVGGHGDDHSECGCGANAKLGLIMQYLVDNVDSIVDTLSAAGIEVSHIQADKITSSAANLLAKEGFFRPGTEIDAAIQNHAETGHYQVVVGQHNEIRARFNTKEGTTFDRHAAREAYGDDYQIFNVDLWAFAPTAGIFSDDEPRIADKVLAMQMYNVATAYVLCGPTQEAFVR